MEGLKIRLRAVHKYDGPMRLLWDWRRVNYDVDVLVCGVNV